MGTLEERLRVLEGTCFEDGGYRWCHRKSVELHDDE